MKVMLGSAPDSWGVWFADDPRQTPWQRYLDEVAEAGYQWTELGPCGYLPEARPVLAKELAKRGLKASGSVIMPHLEDLDAWPGIERDLDKVGGTLAELGAKFLILIDDFYVDIFSGKQVRPSRLDAEGWKRLVDTTGRIAELAHARYGLSLAVHPHAETHIEYEDQIEALLRDTDPERVFLCLDTGHHAYRGGDAVAFMRKHHARIPYLHLKSVDRRLQQQVEAQKVSFSRAVEMGVFCEPSHGAVDFPALRDVLVDVDYQGWAVVEQDMFPAPFDKPLPIARRTRSYLQSIGIG